MIREFYLRFQEIHISPQRTQRIMRLADQRASQSRVESQRCVILVMQILACRHTLPILESESFQVKSTHAKEYVVEKRTGGRESSAELTQMATRNPRANNWNKHIIDYYLPMLLYIILLLLYQSHSPLCCKLKIS